MRSVKVGIRLVESRAPCQLAQPGEGGATPSRGTNSHNSFKKGWYEMIIVKPSVTVEWATPNALEVIERAGRTCYQSTPRENPEAFVKMIIARGHESVLEHAAASLRFICDRGVTHEMVRHRIASYSQESTRYCNYAKDQFGGEIMVIQPPGLEGDDLAGWEYAVKCTELTYIAMVNRGVSPQIARSVLPNCLKTEIVMTANLREWRHFFKLRTAATAHPQMREVAVMAHELLKGLVPVVFDV